MALRAPWWGVGQLAIYPHAQGHRPAHSNPVQGKLEAMFGQSKTDLCPFRCFELVAAAWPMRYKPSGLAGLQRNLIGGRINRPPPANAGKALPTYDKTAQRVRAQGQPVNEKETAGGAASVN